MPFQHQRPDQPHFINLCSTASYFLVICVALICPSHLQAQGENNPTGAAGSFSGSIATGGGSFDPYERNASRSVTDIVVPGAVVPFTYTRIWNSRGGWRDNWEWDIKQDEVDREESGSVNWHPGDEFRGYTISYPDGRVVPFTKPPYAVPGTPGPYSNAAVLDRFVVDPDRAHGHLFLADGSVVTFTIDPDDILPQVVTSIVDPHGQVVTIDGSTWYSPYVKTVTEPGGRWIRISPSNISGATVVTTSLGQSVTYPPASGTSGNYPHPQGYGPDTGMYDSGVDTSLESVTYNDVLDPITGQPVQAQYVYKSVLPPQDPNYPNNPHPIIGRLVWASDPMFDGPLQQIKYLYVDSTPNQLIADPTRRCVVEERSATSADDVGTMVTRVEMPSNATWSIDAGGYSPNFSDRIETHGDGAVRTISYFNPDIIRRWFDSHNVYHVSSGAEQMFVDHFTDFTNNLSVTERHEYDWTHMLQTPTKITDMRGNVTLQTLETVLGHITQETHPDTNYLSWTYTDPANPYYLASKTDELGNATTYTRDSVTHLVTQINHPDGSFETFAYNSFGQVTDHRLPSGAHEYLTYDGRGLKTSEWNDAYSAEVTYYTYDAWDRVATVREPRAVALNIPYSVRYEYNGRHQITKAHYPATGGLSDPTVTYGYDNWGHCTSITDELGNTRTMVYDNYGRITSYTEPLNAPGWDGTGNVTTRTWTWYYYRWNSAGFFDSSTHISKNWSHQIEPAFNAAGDRKMTTRAYDPNDRVILEETGWIQRADGSNYFGPDGETHSFTYDAEGNKTSYTDPRNRLTTYDYDSRNRLTTTTEPLSRITTTVYDAASNKTKVTFPDTTTQQWLSYNAFGKPGAFIDERGNTTNFWYWPFGPMKILVAVGTHRDKDGGGTEDQYTYFYPDLMGRPQQTQFPDNSWERTFYQFGQLKTVQTRKGAIKTINYDARGRETSNSWSDGTPGINRIWDDANRLTVIWNTYSIIDYGYDGAGQMLYEGDNVSGSGGRTQTNYLRYPNGDMSYVHYPGGPLIRHEYTARGQLSGVSWDDIDEGWTYQRYLGNYYYLADGKVDHLDYGNGVSTAFVYDGRGFTSAVNTTGSGAVYSNRTYYRDNRDRIYAWAKSNTPADNPMENGRGDRYTYDAEGQLTAASYEALTPNTTPTGAQRTESFVYDQLGNRKGVNQIASLGTVTVHRRDNGLNQYQDWTQSAINYENNGNLYQDGWISASYNALNQPISIWSWRVNPTGNSVSFGYDPLGRCVKRWTGSSDPYYNPATYFVYDGWNLLQEGASPWYPARIYVHGARVDEIIYSANTQTGESAFHQYDARGHCTLLTDNSGAITEQYQYDAFGYPYFFDASGNALLNGSVFGNRFLFTGREWIKEIAVYDFRNRHYLPELGRFIQPDPKEFEAGDYNLYRYCHNDPINKIDPFGLLEIIWRESGNTTDPKTENHYTDEKLKTPEGNPSAGKTTHELTTSGNKSGSVTANLKVDWKVRRELAEKDPKLAALEKQHADRWHSWVERMKSNNSDVSKYFANKSYASPEEAAKAVRAFMEPYRRNENIQQKLDYDLKGGPHDIDYHLKD